MTACSLYGAFLLGCLQHGCRLHGRQRECLPGMILPPGNCQGKGCAGSVDSADALQVCSAPNKPLNPNGTVSSCHELLKIREKRQERCISVRPRNAVLTDVPSSRCASPEGKVMPLSV